MATQGSGRSRYGRVGGGWLAALVVLGMAASPVRATVIDHEGWFQVTATGPITGKWRAFLEAQPRIGARPDADGVGMRAFLGRGAVGYDVGAGWSLWQGYGWTPTFQPYRVEHRAFQQALYDRRVGPFETSNRTRIEQRWIEGVHGVALRARHQVRIAYPLPRRPDWSLVVADEPFVNLNSATDGPVSGFEQNRLYAGISRKLGRHLRVEIDYLNQVVNGRRDQEATMRHSGVLQLAFAW